MGIALGSGHNAAGGLNRGELIQELSELSQVFRGDLGKLDSAPVVSLSGKGDLRPGNFSLYLEGVQPGLGMKEYFYLQILPHFQFLPEKKHESAFAGVTR